MDATAARIAANAFALIDAHVHEGNFGQVLDASHSYQIPHQPERLWKPAVSFIQRGRLPDGHPVPEPVRLIPDFALLIVSPDELAEDLQGTILDVVSGYKQLIWVVYPRIGAVQVFQECGISRYLYLGEELDGARVLPDLVVPTEALFKGIHR